MQEIHKAQNRSLSADRSGQVKGKVNAFKSKERDSLFRVFERVITTRTRIRLGMNQVRERMQKFVLSRVAGLIICSPLTMRFLKLSSVDKNIWQRARVL